MAQSTAQPSEGSEIAETAEQIKRLDAAAATITVENDNEGSASSRKLRMLSQFANAYHELGAQSRAIETLERAEQIAIQNKDAFYYYPRTVANIASFYSQIGEIETAQQLLEQAIELSQAFADKRLRPYAIGEVAEAYSLMDNPTITQMGLASLVELIEDTDNPLWVERAPFVPRALVEAYGQLENEAEANSALTSLLSVSQPPTLDTLVVYAIAYSQQNNPEAAQQQLEQAMNLIRSSDKGISVLYDIEKVALGYGALNDVAVADKALTELITLSDSTRFFDSEELSEEEELLASLRRMDYDLNALGAIAIAYRSLGNVSKAQAVLAPLTERFSVLAEVGILPGGLLYLGPLVQAYGEIGDIPGQQAVLQMMFDSVPALQELSLQGVAISDVTPGYLGITTIMEGYVATEDDAIAQKRLQMLEDFFKETRFAEGGFSEQLTILATAAIRRGDEANALRLMSEAMQLIGTPEDALVSRGPRAINSGSREIGSDQLAKVLRYMAWNYGKIQDAEAQQAGLETTKQLAAKLLEPDFKSEVDSAIARAYVGL